jgi:PAS domain S-box-containing protein
MSMECQALLVVCDLDWRISECLLWNRKMVKKAANLDGSMFVELVKGGRREARERFTKDVEAGRLSRVLLDISITGSATPMQVLGLRAEGWTVICAGDTLSDIQALVRAAEAVEPPGISEALRAFYRAFLSDTEDAAKGQKLLDEISRLNNEVVNANRELAIRNIELYEEKERNRIVIACIADGVVATDIEGNVIMMNPMAEELTGWSIDEASGHPLGEVVRSTSEDGRSMKELFQRAMGEGLCVEASPDSEIIRKDGTTLPIYETVALITDSRKEASGLAITLHDVSERKRMIKALRKKEAELSLIFNNVNEGIHLNLLNSNGSPGKLLACNRVAMEMLGYSKEEIMRLVPADYVVGERVPPSEEVFRSLLERGEAVFETSHRRKDGSIIPVEINVHRSVLEGVDVVIAAVRDISERKLAEEELLRSNQRMAANLEELHRTNQALTEMSLELKQTSRKLNLLNSITRHDVLNQVMAIEGSAALLEMKESDPVKLKTARRLLRSAQTIRQQMEFAKLYQEIGEQAPLWLDLRKVIAHATAQAALGVLKVENETGAYEVLADPMFEKVIFNLMDNAIRHGGAKSIWLSTAEEGGRMVISVEDDGTGVSAKMREHIFERGFGNNTGFGLFLSREILEITGVTIEEIGEAGEGAKFVITIPAGNWRPM